MMDGDTRKQWCVVLGVVIVYLAVSVALQGWAWSWYIWVIYAAYRLRQAKRNSRAAKVVFGVVIGVAVVAVLGVSYIFILGGREFSLGAPRTWPPKHADLAEYGSFSPYRTYSWDKKLYADQTLDGTKAADLIRVTVYDAETDAIVGSFPAQRAWDFWGICWAPDSYDIWIQSGDVGVYCMRYVDGTWEQVWDALRPDEIVTKYD